MMTRIRPKKSVLLASYMRMLDQLNEGKFTSSTEHATRARLEGKIAAMLEAGVEPSGMDCPPMGIKRLEDRAA